MCVCGWVEHILSHSLRGECFLGLQVVVKEISQRGWGGREREREVKVVLQAGNPSLISIYALVMVVSCGSFG